MTIWLRSRLLTQHGAYDVSNTCIATKFKRANLATNFFANKVLNHQISYGTSLFTNFQQEIVHFTFSPFSWAYNKDRESTHTRSKPVMTVLIQRHVSLKNSSLSSLYRTLLHYLAGSCSSTHHAFYGCRLPTSKKKLFSACVHLLSLQKKIILRSWVLKQMQKNIEISTSWPGRRHLHYMLRFIIFWQTLWIHSYSPNLESKVPRCNERSLSVNLGPSSWSPAFFWFLKIYLRRTCKKNEKKSAIKETLSVDVVRWWLRLAFEQALLFVLFGQAKRVSRERASEGPLPASSLARAFSRESFHSPK